MKINYLIYLMSQQINKRLIKDISDIYTNPLNDNNIFYIHDTNDMLTGYAMIVGPSDTPYNFGYYFFKFKFPPNYPFNPPELIFSTCDNKTRFHPNLYVSGKVCLSILNTWAGESWSSCQNISTILLTLSTILTKNPLIHEPGFQLKNPSVKPYNVYVEYKNYEIAFLNMLNKKNLPSDFYIFYDIMVEYANKNKDSLLEKLNDKKIIYPNMMNVNTNVYGMNNFIIDYKKLYSNIIKYFNEN
jgi:ubiquitin-conjugating enzyme E2 Z